MADIKDIERFLRVGYGSGSGYGSGPGSGYGDGYGPGSGDGYGDGSGYGSGYVYGDGYDSGYGDGYGSGYGYGYGDGYDSGYGLISFDGQKVYYIDGIPTVIERVHGNLAKGYIVNKDLTTSKCYIAKSENLFAHGETAKDAERALQGKIFANMDVDAKIDVFLTEFKLGEKYPAKAFYEWHHKLTGSCEFGRNAFIKTHGIDLDNGMYTVKEFIDLTKNDFGGDIIKQLAEKILPPGEAM